MKDVNFCNIDEVIAKAILKLAGKDLSLVDNVDTFADKPLWDSLMVEYEQRGSICMADYYKTAAAVVLGGSSESDVVTRLAGFMTADSGNINITKLAGIYEVYLNAIEYLMGSKKTFYIPETINGCGERYMDKVLAAKKYYAESSTELSMMGVMLPVVMIESNWTYNPILMRLAFSAKKNLVLTSYDGTKLEHFVASEIASDVIAIKKHLSRVGIC